MDCATALAFDLPSRVASLHVARVQRHQQAPVEPIPDHVLIERYLDGDSTSFEQLIERYRRPLYAFLLHLARNPQEADDLYQETFLRAVRGLPRYRHRDKFRCWLFRIARNLAIDRARRHQPSVALDAPTETGATLHEALPAGGPAPDQSLALREIGELIWSAVAELPPSQREVFALRHQAGLSFKEIALLQEAPLNTVLARMHYAVLKLRAVLTEAGFATDADRAAGACRSGDLTAEGVPSPLGDVS